MKLQLHTNQVTITHKQVTCRNNNEVATTHKLPAGTIIKLPLYTNKLPAGTIIKFPLDTNRLFTNVTPSSSSNNAATVELKFPNFPNPLFHVW